ncbi:o-succinylbenzoate synthase [Gracilibacillus xinjiangensis]|uniref:o-succinylbenzoate synthase n=1 Tax=Gracilibacillus xinjiangensis TaxID=1193282 RepID=A0ABV8WSP1_9BACI
MIQIEQLIMHRMKMPLKHPFTNSRRTIDEKDFYIIELVDQAGNRGYGETVAFDTPWYTEETTTTVRYIMEHELAPILATPFDHPSSFIKRCQPVRRHQMAKAAVEGAIWDLYAKQHDVPLYKAIGGTNSQVPVGAAIGMKEDIPTLIEAIQREIDHGYKRIKLKIKPGRDLQILDAVRSEFPDILLMADANSAYTLDDLDHIKQFDQFDLMMIEQPLAHDDFVDHAILQKEIRTPICLDESIHTLSDVKTAIALHSCQIISVKLGKAGGFSQAKRIHDLCAENNIQVWCGGMLEAGVGRAQSLALATLPNFTLPADPGASNRYWHQDIINPEVEINNGIITLPDKPGIGYDIDEEALQFYRTERKSIPIT